jgi:hypothetical protein
MSTKKKSTSFPATDARFDAAFRKLMAALAADDPDSSAPTTVTWTRLGLNFTTFYTPLVNILGSSATNNTWLKVYPEEKSKATHNGTNKDEKNKLKKNALALIRPARLILKAQDKANPGFLSSNDRLVWFIPDPNQFTPSLDTMRTQQYVPVLGISEIKNLQHRVDAHNSESPKSKGLPEGVCLMEISRYIGTTAPTDPSQYTHLLFTGRSSNVSNFLTTHRKLEAWYIARYIGTTGEEGNLSTPVSATVA